MISKKRIWLKQFARMRKIRRCNRVRKRIAKFGYNRRPQSKSVNGRKHGERIPLEERVPQNFCIENISGVISFIHRVENKCKSTIVRKLIIRMDDVTKIDMYAISLLLSMLNRLSCRHIQYWGTYPSDSGAKRYILDSGFLDVMKSNIKRAGEKQTRNQIFMVGKDSVDSHLLGKAVRESMKYIIGVESVYPPLYDDLLEISANSVEHANNNISDKNWLVSISIEEEKLHFVVTDTGAGILSTIKKKWIQLVQDKISKTDSDILLDIFKKKYQSITGESNRHKGLPIIYESYLDGLISNFKVLTNKVYYEFNGDIPHVLPKAYNGVLFSWTVDRNNYEKWRETL